MTEARKTTPLELRLYVAAALAVAYTLAWRTVSHHTPVTAPQPQPRAARIETIVLPPGWQHASQPTNLVRAPSRAVPRVRTRSS